MVALIIIVANVVIGVISYRTSSSSLTNAVNQNLALVSEKIALEIEDMNEKEFNLLNSLAALPFIKVENVPLLDKTEQLKQLVNIEVKTASKEMAEGNKVILEEVRVLQDTTGEMKSSMEEMSDGALKINETEQSLELISRHMKDTLFFISGFRCIRGSASTRQVP